MDAIVIAKLLAANLPVKEYASTTLTTQLLIFVWNFPISTGYPVNTLISNALGEQNLDKIKRYIRASYLLGVLQSVIVGVAVYFSSSMWCKIFTSDPEIQRLIVIQVDIYLIVLLFDIGKNIYANIGRAAGKESQTNLFYFISFYLTSIPVAYVLMYVCEMNVAGLWIGLDVGQVIAFVFMLAQYCTFDFQLQAQKIEEKLKREKQKLIDDMENSADSIILRPAQSVATKAGSKIYLNDE